jgi:type II secretion system protein L
VLALLAPGLAQPGLTNLLQGAYKPRTSSAGVWQQWRWAAALAGALLLLHGLGSWWQLRQMRKASVAMDASIAQLYGAVFPGQTPGIDPRLAMEKRFKSLAGDANQQGELLHQLAAVAAAKQNVPVTRLQSLTFKPGSLQLKLSAPDASTLEQFSQALRGSGYTAQVVAGGVQGTAYEGEVELRNPGT